MWKRIRFTDGTNLIIDTTTDTGLCSIPVPSGFINDDGILDGAVINKNNGQLIDLNDKTIKEVEDLNNAEFSEMGVDDFVSTFF